MQARTLAGNARDASERPETTPPTLGRMTPIELEAVYTHETMALAAQPRESTKPGAVPLVLKWNGEGTNQQNVHTPHARRIFNVTQTTPVALWPSPPGPAESFELVLRLRPRRDVLARDPRGSYVMQIVSTVNG